MATRYADPFLNALMYSHEMSVHADLYYDDDLVGPLSINSGSVSGDRAGSVRRTASVTLNPDDIKSGLLGPYLNPYGSQVKISRGLRYPGGAIDEQPVFRGRIDVVESSLGGLNLRCSDLAADVVDARFLDIARPQTLPGAPTTILGCIKALIIDVFGPTFPFDTTGITDTTMLVRPDTSWAQERGDALDSLCTQLQGGSEWYIDMFGIAHIHPLPAVLTSGAEPVWIIDSGDEGVLVDRVATMDRQGVYNGVRVESEPVGGINPAVGTWIDDPAPPYNGDENSPTRWGYAFGKVVNYYTGQQVDTTAKANALARTLGLNSISSVRSVAVTCIPNPKIRLGDVVRVFSGQADVDGMFYVQSLVLPLDPESPMTMTLYSAYQGVGLSGYRDAELTIPKGATWQPTR